MRYVVTEAAGFLGSHLVETLRIESELGGRATRPVADGLRAQSDWAFVRVAAR